MLSDTVRESGKQHREDRGSAKDDMAVHMDGNCEQARRLASHFGEHEVSLIARGILSAPKRIRSFDEVLPTPAGRISDEIMSQVWREEREGR
jgi:hypothetical protein